MWVDVNKFSADLASVQRKFAADSRDRKDLEKRLGDSMRASDEGNLPEFIMVKSRVEAAYNILKSEWNKLATEHDELIKDLDKRSKSGPLTGNEKEIFERYKTTEQLVVSLKKAYEWLPNPDNFLATIGASDRNLQSADRFWDKCLSFGDIEGMTVVQTLAESQSGVFVYPLIKINGKYAVVRYRPDAWSEPVSISYLDGALDTAAQNGKYADISLQIGKMEFQKIEIDGSSAIQQFRAREFASAIHDNWDIIVEAQTPATALLIMQQIAQRCGLGSSVAALFVKYLPKFSAVAKKPSLASLLGLVAGVAIAFSADRDCTTDDVLYKFEVPEAADVTKRGGRQQRRRR